MFIWLTTPETANAPAHPGEVGTYGQDVRNIHTRAAFATLPIGVGGYGLASQYGKGAFTRSLYGGAAGGCSYKLSNDILGEGITPGSGISRYPQDPIGVSLEYVMRAGVWTTFGLLGEGWSVLTRNEAIVYRYEGAPYHVSIEVRKGLKTLHTHQVVLSETGAVTEIRMVTGEMSAKALESQLMQLESAAAAMARQRQLMAQGNLGQYKYGTNSCASHAVDVLRHGGAAGLPAGQARALYKVMPSLEQIAREALRNRRGGVNAPNSNPRR